MLPAETRTDYNVIAELPGKNTDNVVMAGAHLDSVIEGPGINDNGSGSAALLETALMMANLKPENTLRFALVGRRGAGPRRLRRLRRRAVAGGARPHRAVHELRHGRLAELHLHGVRRRRVDVPGAGGVPIPPGSEAIEDVYESYYTLIGEPYDDTEFSGRSDYEAFILAGIPSGGLFTGAEVIKTEEQEAIWGGTAGEQFDPCYHLACDTFEQRRPARARGQQRPDRVRDADVRLLDRVGERGAGQEGARPGASSCRRRPVRRARSPRRTAGCTGRVRSADPERTLSLVSRRQHGGRRQGGT